MIEDIKPILKELNNNSEICGSVIMTKDGIVITSHFKNDFNEDLIAAIASSICLTLKSSLFELNTTFSRYTINTDTQKLVLADLGKSILLVVANFNVNLSDLNMSIFQASTLIKKTGRIDI